MATLTGGVIAASNTDFNLLQNSQEMTRDIMTTPIASILMEHGCINYSAKGAIGKGAGDEASLPNIPRLDAAGDDIALSTYGQASTLVGGTRKIRVDMLRKSVKTVKNGTIYKQRDSHNLLDAKWVKENLTAWYMNMYQLGFMYQGAGNTATSRSVPLVRSTAFSGTVLNQVSGMVAGIAPSTIYTHYGSNASLANPSAITATNALLTYQDLQLAVQNTDRSYAGVPIWNQMDGDIRALLFVSRTGEMQLLNQARSAGADSTLSEFRYRIIEGGRGKWNGLDGFVLPELGLKVITLRDDMLPRAVHSGTENALSRTAIMVGKGAFDLAFGNAYPGTDKPSVNIKIDDKTFGNDDWDYITAQAIFAIKKAQLPGFGANLANTYDAATYVIQHSAAS